MKSTAQNSARMKSGNRRLLLNIIKNKPVSRAELARITGLTRAAVTLIVDELVTEGILREVGTIEANYGRKPTLLDLNPDKYYAMGLSITRIGCRVGLMNCKGILLSSSEIDISSCRDAEECLETIQMKIDGILAEKELNEEKLLGLGISMPGPVDIIRGRVLNPPNFELWHNFDITDRLEKHFHKPVFLENNSVSLALAEKNYGRGREFRNFMLLVVDSGIGAGIVINDGLYRGYGGFGSEVGHTSIDIHGIQCKCGNRGCLETYASIPAILASAGYACGQKTWQSVVDEALAGEDACRELVKKEALYLSTGIVNMINVLELDAVILTGDIHYKPQMLLVEIRKNVYGSMITRNMRQLPIMESLLGDGRDVVSAASILTEKYFNGEIEI